MVFRSTTKKNIHYDNPESLFFDLRSRTVEGLLGHQVDMLRRYSEVMKEKRDIAFELPTGSGKTLVGLLIAEYRRRVMEEKVVYLCPTKQLVHQVVEQSKAKYGIKSTAFVGPKKEFSPEAKADYTNRDTIAVTPYGGLFNTSPYFSDFRAPDLIVLDDAHSSENYIADFWSLSIRRNDTSYRGLIDILRSAFSESHYLRLISDLDNAPEDRLWVEKIPTPSICDRITDIITFLDVQTDHTDLYFPWSMIRSHLAGCHIYASWSSILIRPVIPPSLTHKPFANAKQRIYMSATLGLGGDLERITGVDKIHRLPIPSGWDKHGVGRRFFIFPEVSLSADQAISLAVKMTELTPRSLVLVPDDRAVEQMVESFEQRKPKPTIYRAADIEKSKRDFINADNGVAILANRFDGIDLYGDECRLLIVKDLPRATNLQEKFLQTRMAASVLLADRLRTRIIQAVGRCTRSATDYSAVCILGQDLIDSLIQRDNRRFFHPELQGELTFGFDESSGSSQLNYLENLTAFLQHGDDWNDADSQIVERRNGAKVETDNAAGKLLRSASLEVEYQYAIWQEDYVRALSITEQILALLDGDDVKGYRAFWYYLAGSAAWLEYHQGDKTYLEVARRKYRQAAACAAAVPWLTKLSKLTSDSEDLPENDDTLLSVIVEGLESKLANLGISSSTKFEKEVKLILDYINSDDAQKFEEGHKRAGELLGYTAGNSDDNAAPDPWWIAGDQLCIVAEDNNTAKDNKPLGANKVRQAASHPNWIKQNVKLAQDAVIVPVVISTATTIEHGAVVHTGNILYWHIDDFRGWVERAISTIRKLRTSFSAPGDITWRTKAAIMFKDNGIDPQGLLSKLSKTPLNLLPVHGQGQQDKATD